MKETITIPWISAQNNTDMGVSMTFDKLALRTTGDRVRWLRKERRMTQKELAAKAGISQPTLSNIECNDTRESFATTVIALAGALNANITWLQTGRGNPFDVADNDKNELLELIERLSPEQVALVKGLVRTTLEHAPRGKEE